MTPKCSKVLKNLELKTEFHGLHHGSIAVDFDSDTAASSMLQFVVMVDSTYLNFYVALMPAL